MWDISPVERGISRYASGPTLPLMTLAFLSLAAAFPDANIPPARSIPHTVFGFVFFVTAVAGLYTSHRSSSALAWLPVVALLLFFAPVAGVPVLARIPGVLQRVCFASLVVSLMALSARH